MRERERERERNHADRGEIGGYHKFVFDLKTHASTYPQSRLPLSQKSTQLQFSVAVVVLTTSGIPRGPESAEERPEGGDRQGQGPAA